MQHTRTVGQLITHARETSKHASECLLFNEAVLVVQELSVPLTKWLKAFPAMSSLHPFEAALLDLTVGQGTYASVLGKVDTLRKSLQEASTCSTLLLPGIGPAV